MYVNKQIASLMTASMQTFGILENLPLLSYIIIIKSRININYFGIISIIFFLYCTYVSNSLINLAKIFLFIFTIFVATQNNAKITFNQSGNKFILFVFILFLTEQLLSSIGIQSPLVRGGGRGLLLFAEPSYAILTIMTVLLSASNFVKMKTIGKIKILLVIFFVGYILDSLLFMLFSVTFIMLHVFPNIIVMMIDKLVIPLIVLMFVVAYQNYEFIIVNYPSESFRFLTAILSIISLVDFPLGSGTIFLHEIFDLKFVYDGFWDMEYIMSWERLSAQAPAFNLILFGGYPAVCYCILLTLMFFRRSSAIRDVKERTGLRILFCVLFFIQSTLGSFLLFFVLLRRRSV